MSEESIFTETHDPRKAPREYRPSKVRVKKVERPDPQSPIAVIVLDVDGEEYNFAIGIWELLDEEYIAKMLNYWKNVVIPYRRKAAKMEGEKLEQYLKTLEGMEV